MNSNMYYTKDTLTVGLEDPADQFAWLDSVLRNATANHEKVCDDICGKLSSK